MIPHAKPLIIIPLGKDEEKMFIYIVYTKNKNVSHNITLTIFWIFGNNHTYAEFRNTLELEKQLFLWQVEREAPGIELLLTLNTYHFHIT